MMEVSCCLREYWDEVWAEPVFDEYRKYVDGHISASDTYEFISHFQSNRICSICDAACGFGAYSVMLCKKGFQLSGFDISANSVNLTKAMLAAYNCPHNDYKVCDITNIAFVDESFDGVVAHAVIDHLHESDAKTALRELLRITKQGGLIYITFDGLSEVDETNDYVTQADGSRQYSDGLLFRYYTDDDINDFLCGQTVIHRSINRKGDREIIISRNKAE
jgi:ubiquinone/menaquinone biosynthesis C-methylase UbiE